MSVVLGKLFGILSVVSAAMLLGACQTTSNVDCSKVDYINYIPTDDGCLAITILNRKSADENPAMLVFLEGDQGGSGRKLGLPGAISRPDTPHAILVEISRPGYVNWRGDQSSGSAQWASMAPLSEVASVAQGIQNLKDHYNVSRMVIMGQSGGAAYAGTIIGLYEDLIDIAILHGCPCDMNMWIGDFRYRRMNPMNYVDSVSKSTSVVVINGRRDDNTSPRQARSYINELIDADVPAHFVLGRGGHSYYDNWTDVRRIIYQALAPDRSEFDLFVSRESD